jgi:hypothetical protein
MIRLTGSRVDERQMGVILMASAKMREEGGFKLCVINPNSPPFTILFFFSTTKLLIRPLV